MLRHTLGVRLRVSVRCVRVRLRVKLTLQGGVVGWTFITITPTT